MSKNLRDKAGARQPTGDKPQPSQIRMLVPESRINGNTFKKLLVKFQEITLDAGDYEGPRAE